MFRRENFGSFQNACLKLGCKDTETAVFEDVYDNKDMGQFLINIIALARNTQYQPDYKGPILQDAAKNSGPGKAVAATAKPYLGPTLADVASKNAQEAIEASRYTEHGVVMDPTKNVHSGQKDAKPAEETKVKYCGDYNEAAMKQAQEAKSAATYTEHGIVMNPDENRSHGQKD